MIEEPTETQQFGLLPVEPHDGLFEQGSETLQLALPLSPVSATPSQQSDAVHDRTPERDAPTVQPSTTTQHVDNAAIVAPSTSTTPDAASIPTNASKPTKPVEMQVAGMPSTEPDDVVFARHLQGVQLATPQVAVSARQAQQHGGVHGDMVEEVAPTAQATSTAQHIEDADVTSPSTTPTSDAASISTTSSSSTRRSNHRRQGAVDLKLDVAGSSWRPGPAYSKPSIGSDKQTILDCTHQEAVTTPARDSPPRDVSWAYGQGVRSLRRLASPAHSPQSKSAGKKRVSIGATDFDDPGPSPTDTSNRRRSRPSVDSIRPPSILKLPAKENRTPDLSQTLSQAKQASPEAFQCEATRQAAVAARIRAQVAAQEAQSTPDAKLPSSQLELPLHESRTADPTLSDADIEAINSLNEVAKLRANGHVVNLGSAPDDAGQ